MAAGPHYLVFISLPTVTAEELKAAQWVSTSCTYAASTARLFQGTGHRDPAIQTLVGLQQPRAQPSVMAAEGSVCQLTNQISVTPSSLEASSQSFLLLVRGMATRRTKLSPLPVLAFRLYMA